MMKKNETLDINRLKLCLQVRILDGKDVTFKIFYVDEGIDIKNKKNNIYVNMSNFFRIRKGEKLSYSALSLILPTDMIRDVFSHTYTHTFLSETVRELLLRCLVKDISKMINGTFEENPNTRIEYKNDYWLFY
jgi:hypothetical protein